jgi:hypothetical protein
MMTKLIDELGGWRSLASGFVIFSFLAFVGLLVASGHSPHLFLAVAYLLLAAFVLTRLAPRDTASESTHDFDPDAGFRLYEPFNQESASCECCGPDAVRNNEVKQ